MGLAVTVACGSVRLARWCFLGASSVVLVAQMARTTRRGRVRVLGRVLGRVQGWRTPPPSQAQIVSSSSKFKNDSAADLSAIAADTRRRYSRLQLPQAIQWPQSLHWRAPPYIHWRAQLASGFASREILTRQGPLSR